MDFEGLMAPTNWGGYADTLGGLFTNGLAVRNAGQANTQVQSSLGQNAGALNTQIQSLQDQIATNRQQAQDMYQRSLGDVTNQNQGLQSNIGTMTNNLNALSDPNSPYMQMARQSIERKDAAAGRNSQWGDRETQLAGTLADYVGKYSPGIQNSITGARHQIDLNNQGLASLYSQANNPSDRNTLALIQALQAQQSLASQQNGIGRGATNAASNAQSTLIQNLMRAGGGVLGSLFGSGNNSGENSMGTSNMFDWNNSGQQGGIIEGLGANGYYGNSAYGTQSETGDPYNSDGGAGLLDHGLWAND